MVVNASAGGTKVDSSMADDLDVQRVEPLLEGVTP
jgi:hypothetical protein